MKDDGSNSTARKMTGACFAVVPNGFLPNNIIFPVSALLFGPSFASPTFTIASDDMSNRMMR